MLIRLKGKQLAIINFRKTLISSFEEDRSSKIGALIFHLKQHPYLLLVYQFEICRFLKARKSVSRYYIHKFYPKDCLALVSFDVNPVAFPLIVYFTLDSVLFIISLSFPELILIFLLSGN